MVQGRCMKCRTQVNMVNVKEILLVNKRRALQGQCPTCGTKVTRILGMVGGGQA